MKFYAPDKPIHISLTSGHAALVTKEGVDLEPKFYKDAFALGCLTEPAEPVVKVVEPKQEVVVNEERIPIIKAAIEAMLDESVEGDFTSQGKPNLFKLADRTGFKVGKEEMEAIFDTL